MTYVKYRLINTRKKIDKTEKYNKGLIYPEFQTINSEKRKSIIYYWLTLLSQDGGILSVALFYHALSASKERKRANTETW